MTDPTDDAESTSPTEPTSHAEPSGYVSEPDGPGNPSRSPEALPEPDGYVGERGGPKPAPKPTRGRWPLLPPPRTGVEIHVEGNSLSLAAGPAVRVDGSYVTHAPRHGRVFLPLKEGEHQIALQVDHAAYTTGRADITVQVELGDVLDLYYSMPYPSSDPEQDRGTLELTTSNTIRHLPGAGWALLLGLGVPVLTVVLILVMFI